MVCIPLDFVDIEHYKNLILQNLNKFYKKKNMIIWNTQSSEKIHEK